MEKVAGGPAGRVSAKQAEVAHFRTLETILELLSKPTTPPTQAPSTAAAKPFNPCDPPSTATAPAYVIPMRRTVPFLEIDLAVDPASPLTVACVGASLPPNRVSGAPSCELALDIRLAQTWNLQGLSIGDLASTMTLAPGEQTTFEFQNSLRRVLDQTTEDDADEMTSSESTTFDKEVLNVARTSSNTQHWYVDGQASYSQGSKKNGLSAEVKAGYSQTLSEETRRSIDHTSEATKKSAHTLKTLHKVIVRGTTEEFTQSRMTRTIRNPYRDRTLSLNVFQLLKQFSVKTELDEIWPVLVIYIDHLEFNADFVQANQDFLRSTVVESSLLSDLSAAVIGARGSISYQHAVQVAKDALYYLYRAPNIFQLPPDRVGTFIPDPPLDPNDPANSLNANLRKDGTIDTGGLKESLEKHVPIFFATLNYFYRVYLDYLQSSDPQLLDENAILMVQSLASAASLYWTDIVKPGSPTLQETDIERLFDDQNYTEIFRRVPGFQAMASGMLAPLSGGDAKETVDQWAAQLAALQRLLAHLRCHNSYYTQQYLTYIAKRTKNEEIVRFVNQVVAAIGAPESDLVFAKFDVERSFIDRQYVVVPSFRAIEDRDITSLARQLATNGNVPDFASASIVPAVADIEVPADGIHLEVAPGTCTLGQLPPEAITVDTSVQGAAFKLSAPGH